MISYSCSSRGLNDRENYPTFARTTALYVEMANFIIDIIKYHYWDRVVLVEGPESIWRETVGEFQVQIIYKPKINQFIYLHFSQIQQSIISSLHV
jgi:hypothetical protein